MYTDKTNTIDTICSTLNISRATHYISISNIITATPRPLATGDYQPTSLRVPTIFHFNTYINKRPIKDRLTRLTTATHHY